MPISTALQRLAASLALLSLFAFAPTAVAQITVTTADDEVNADGDCSLREAVAAANTDTAVDGCAAGDEDDTIIFDNDYVITLTLGEILLSDDVSISGLDSNNRVVIDAAGDSRIFDVGTADEDAEVAFASLVLRNGNSGMNSSAPDAGGAVDLKPGSAATFTDVDVLDSVAGINGGGIHGAGDTEITITTSDAGSSLISGNEAQGDDAGMGGGGVWGAGSTVISGNVTISGNAATGTSGSGGGVFNFGGTLDITDATISDNSANRAGGGVEDFGDDDDDLDVTLTDVTLSGNFIDAAMPGNGGGFHSGGGNATVTGGSVTGNTAVEGGGLWSSGTLDVDGTMIMDNEGTGDDADNGGGGVYNQAGTITLTDVTIDGNSATGTAGSGGGVLNNMGELTINGGTISNNTSNRAGGGIEDAGGMTTVMDADVMDNDAGTSPGNGGGLHTGGGDVSVSGGTFSGNTAVEGGGLWSSGSLTVDGTVIEDNEALSDADEAFEGGGGLFNQAGTMMVTDATISGNTATGPGGSGGGLFNNGDGNTTVMNSAFVENTSARAGGGVEVNGGTVTLTDTDFNDNATGDTPGNGGALHVTMGTVNATGGEVTGNTAAAEGGGFWNNAGWTMTVSGTSFTDNTASGDAADNGGGGLFNNGGTLNVDSITVSGNAADGMAGSGGGLFNAEGTVSISASTFSGNTANRAGGAVEVVGGMTSISTSTLDGNDAGDSPGNGGGVHISGAGTVDITMSTVSNNTAVNGGGLWTSGAGTMTVTNSTVTMNDAPNGGNLYLSGTGGSVSLASSTIAASAQGVGLFSEGGTFELMNTIVALNEGGTCSGPGTFTSNGNNLLQNIMDDCTITTQGSDILDQDPMLGPLADNGGPTLTHALMMGSPAIDAGLTDLATDQRGFGRDDGADDIGAFEFDGTPVSNEGGPDDASAMPDGYALDQAYPNPFRDTATLRFGVQEAQHVEVAIYDVTGKRVRVIHSGTVAAEQMQNVRIDAAGLASGLYFVRLMGERVQATQRISVVR